MFAEVFQIRYEKKKKSEERIIFKINRNNKFSVF